MGDSLGNFTYYSSQGKSCIGYVISSENIEHMFNFINVPPTELSDHCIVWFSFNFIIILDFRSDIHNEKLLHIGSINDLPVCQTFKQ